MRFLLLDIKTKLVQSLALVSALMIGIAGAGHAQETSQGQGASTQRPEARNEENKEALTVRKEPEKKKPPNPGSGGDPNVKWSNPSPGIYRPNQGSGTDSNMGAIYRSDLGRGTVRPKGSGADRAGKTVNQPNKVWGAAPSKPSSDADPDARSAIRSDQGSGADRASKPIGRPNTGRAAGSKQGSGTDRASKMGGSGHHGGGH